MSASAMPGRAPAPVKYETGFKQGQTDLSAPNVLVATPTLELGIDIGDLSAVLLASLPRTVASYLQLRLENPLSVINGQVRPPATYLSAEEILRRQYVAHLVDLFARDADRPHPRRAAGALGSAEPGSFLGDLIECAEAGLTTISSDSWASSMVWLRHRSTAWSSGPG